MKKSLSHDAFAATLAALGAVAVALPAAAASPVHHGHAPMGDEGKDGKKKKKDDDGSKKKKKKDSEGGCGSGTCG